MAFITTYEVRGVYADAGGATHSKTWEIQATDHATASTYATTLLGAYDALTSAVRTKYSVAEVFTEDTLAWSPTADANTSDRVTFSLALETQGKFGTISISAPKYGTITQAVDGPTKYAARTDAAELEAYVTLFRSPGWVQLSDGEHVRAANSVRGGKWSSVKKTE